MNDPKSAVIDDELDSEENPKLFISYSWNSLEHQTWVVSLATGLRQSGVDVILRQMGFKRRACIDCLSGIYQNKPPDKSPWQ